MTGSSKREVLNAILREDFTTFIQKAFETVAPNHSYRHNWHIEAIAYELTQCLDGETSRLLITQPPRSLKSICSSVAFVAWVLGKNPKLNFTCVSYSQDLAEDLARQFRRVVESAWYREAFPRMRLAKNTSDHCVTTAGGGRLATSIGGTLTGKGGDIIIIDDPLKAEDSASKSARKTVIDWYSTTLVTRLDDKKRSAIVVVMQRLHEEDLAGYLLPQGGWTHLNLPAIAVERQEIRIASGGPLHIRKPGELLHPDHEPEAALKRLKAELGSQRFSAQYQQEPVPAEGNLVHREWLRSYEAPPKAPPGLRIVQSWDVAGTTSERSDWSVCTTWAMQKKTFYLLDLWRGRLEYPDLKRKVISLQQQHDAATVLIEKAGLGLNLYQDLRADSPAGFPNPIGITPEGDKTYRMEAECARIENGHMLLPQEAPWLADFLNELLAFPHGKYDDQVDSVSQFLNWAWRDVNRSSSVAMFGGELFEGDGYDYGPY